MPAKITVITPSYNQAPFIEQTIRSVLSQTYEYVEHIVVDGGSTDGTVDILKRYPHLVWISEADEGQADALDKGLRLATGEIIGWINADDYYEENVFAAVAECFAKPATMWVVGNLSFVFDESAIVVSDKSPEISRGALRRNPDIVRQQSTFFRKEFLLSAGGWNSEYYMAMDYHLWVRLARIARPEMVDRNWAYFRIHGQQKTTFDNILRQSREIDRILRQEGAPRHLRLAIRVKKRWHWLKGYLKTFCLDKGLLSADYRNRPIRLYSRGRR